MAESDAAKFCDTCGKELIPTHVGGPTCHACLVAILAGSVPDPDDDEEDDDRPICDECESASDELEDGRCPACVELFRSEAEPEEGDYVTTDRRQFWQYGKLAVEVGDGDWIPAIKAHMDREQFWPSVWFESDHGNYHLLRLSDG